MSNLKHWQDKIKEKRKQTFFREFIKEIASWYPLVLNKRDYLSRYLETKRSPKIISNTQFNENIDNNINYGLNYNFDISFFDNFKRLFLSVPLGAIFAFRSDSENSDYADVVSSSENVYLSFNVTRGNQNILYSLGVKENSKNVFNSIMVWDNSDTIYNSHGIVSSHSVFCSKFIYNCFDIWFSSNLVGCKNCIFCDNLENSQYFINNKKYSKEDYFIEKEKILKDKSNFKKYFDAITNIGNNLGNNTNTESIFAINSSDVDKGIFLYNVKNAKNIILSGYSYTVEDIYDTIFCGAKHDCYGTLCCGLQADNLYSCFGVSGGTNLFYCYNMIGGCSYCIGCIGLKNKSYCILNKQYSKEEWEILADKIFSQMESDGTLGDFFPGELNPFYFNDTAASILGDFTKEEVEKEGYMWRDEEIKVDIPEGSNVVYTTPPARSSLPPHLRGTEGELLSDYQGYDSDGNWKINPEILKKVIKDEKGNYYRIVKMEYDFLMKYTLPLPEIHWMDRMKLNFGF